MRKTKWNALILAPALALTFLGARSNASPRPEKQEQSEHAAKKEVVPDSSIYRVHYKMNELESGKTVNSRSYTLMAQPDITASVRIGSKVPYSSGKDIQYQDVGMNIDCTINQQANALLVHTTLSMSTVAGKETMLSGGSNPVFGQVRIQDATSATIGKPAFVGSIDDVVSNRRYVIEVTVTKVM
jgi:hypothetical protein